MMTSDTQPDGQQQDERQPGGESPEPSKMKPGAYIAVGIGVGTALGVAMGNIAAGIGIGVAIGAGIAASKRGN